MLLASNSMVINSWLHSSYFEVHLSVSELNLKLIKHALQQRLTHCQQLLSKTKNKFVLKQSRQCLEWVRKLA